MKNRKMSDYWNMGTAIGLCAAVGIVLGALLQNVVLWLCIGAGVGVVSWSSYFVTLHSKKVNQLIHRIYSTVCLTMSL